MFIYEIKFQDFITKPRSILKFPKPVLMYVLFFMIYFIFLT